MEADGFRIGLFGMWHQAALNAGELARSLGGRHRRLLEAMAEYSCGYAGDGSRSERLDVLGQGNQLAHGRVRIGIVDAFHVKIAQNIRAHNTDFVRMSEQLIHAIRGGDVDFQIGVCRSEMRAIESVDANRGGGIEK